MFGQDAEKVYNDLFTIHSEVAVSAQMLITTYQDHDDSLSNNQRNWRHKIWWWTLPDHDPIKIQLDGIVQAVEMICRPAIQEVRP